MKDKLLLALAGLIEERASNESDFERVILERVAFFVECNNASSVKCMYECVMGMLSGEQLILMKVWLKQEGYFI